MAYDPDEAELLNPKQEAFIENVIRGMQQGPAAVVAGLAGTPNSGRVIGHRLMKDPRIARRVQQRIQAGLSLTDAEVIGTLTEHLRGDITDFIQPDGSIDLAAVKKRGLGHLLSQIEVQEKFVGKNQDPVRTVKFKAYSSQRAAEILAKIRGLLNHTQKLEVEITHKEEKTTHITKMVQNQINNGWSLEEGLKNLIDLGVPMEILQLVNAADLDLSTVTLLSDGDYETIEADETSELLDLDSNEG